MTKAQANVTTQPKFATLALSAAVIGKNIASIKTKSKALDQLIHTTAMASFIHSLPSDMLGHLNATKARDLVAAMSAGQSRLRLAAWFEHFTNVRITSKKDDKGAVVIGVKLLGPSDKGYRVIHEADILAAEKRPYFDLHEERAPVPLVIDSAMFAKMQAQMIAKIDKAKEAGLLSITAQELAEVEALRRIAIKAKRRADGLVSQVGKQVIAKAKAEHRDPLEVAA